MPSKMTKKSAAAAAALPSIPRELLDQIMTGSMTAEAVNAAWMEGWLRSFGQISLGDEWICRGG